MIFRTTTTLQFMIKLKLHGLVIISSFQFSKKGEKDFCTDK